MGQVGQPGLASQNILGNLDGLGNGEVGGVRVFAQPVDDEDGNVANEIADGGWHGGAVGQVGDLGFSMKINTKSGGGDGAVRDGKWDKGERAQGEGSSDGVRFRANVSGATVFEVEGVIESFFEAGESKGIGIDGDAVSVFNGVRAEIIKAGDMIGVAVGVEDGIETGNGGAEGLGAKIGRGIDDDAQRAVFDPNGGAKAAVARVGGGANAAGAGEKGNALGSSGAEKGQTHRF